MYGLMSTIDEDVAAVVRQALKEQGLSQRQAAAPIFGLSQQALSDRLRGRTPFTVADLGGLAAHLKVPVAQLLQAERGSGSERGTELVQLDAVRDVVPDARPAPTAVLVPAVPAVGARALEPHGSRVGVGRDQSVVMGGDPANLAVRHDRDRSERGAR